MAVKREPESSAAPAPAGVECCGCSERNVIARLMHHFGLLERVSDSAPVFSRLSEHLMKVYGQDYAESGRLKRRLDFVREAWIIWRDQLSEGKRNLTMSEAYNLTAMRMNWKKKAAVQSGIEKSQPRESGN